MTDSIKKIAVWIGMSVIGGGICLTILGLAVKSYISSEIKTEMKAAGLVPRSEAEDMRDDIDANTSDINQIENRWNNFIDTIAAQKVD